MSSGTGNIPLTPPGGLSGMGGTDIGTGRSMGGGIPGAAGLGSSGMGGVNVGTSGPSGNSASNPPATGVAQPRGTIIEFF